MSNGDPITIDLGEFRPRVEERVASGEYSSVSEVVQAGLEALAREEAAFDAVLGEKVQRSLDDPRPSIPADDVFERLLRLHEERTNKSGREP